MFGLFGFHTGDLDSKFESFFRGGVDKIQWRYFKTNRYPLMCIDDVGKS